MLKKLIGHGDGATAALACRVLGATSLRIEILRALIASQQVSTAEVMEEFSLSRGQAMSHLKDLEQSGMLTKQRTTHPRGSGPITYWRPNADGVEDVLDSLFSHLLDHRRSLGS